ncbi:hypothetical protein J1605_002886 [Eschrichtius robustus]|uniref:Uncharacterized protein n=1 Tax=Eschrichtius robustus TaxID=9764 RepID=A0AB34HW36_ESCRO|nr:hypothetical protein J1605_002886 [Eschrichtius robustus]
MSGGKEEAAASRQLGCGARSHRTRSASSSRAAPARSPRRGAPAVLAAPRPQPRRVAAAAPRPRSSPRPAPPGPSSPRPNPVNPAPPRAAEPFPPSPSGQVAARKLLQRLGSGTSPAP